MRDARVIRNHEDKLSAALQGADELGATALQHADDGAGVGVACVRPKTFGADIATDKHAIFVHGGRSGAFGDSDFLEARIVWLKEALSLAIHANAPRDKISLAGQDVAIAFDASDAAGLFELAKGSLELLLAVWRQTEAPEQLRHIHRDVIPLRQRSQQGVGDIIYIRHKQFARGGDGGSRVASVNSCLTMTCGNGFGKTKKGDWNTGHRAILKRYQHRSGLE